MFVPERNRRHYLERLQTGLAETKPSSEMARGCTVYAEFRWISIVYTQVLGGRSGVVGARAEGRK